MKYRNYNDVVEKENIIIGSKVTLIYVYVPWKCMQEECTNKSNNSVTNLRFIF